MSNLLHVGVLLALPYFIYAIIQTIRKQDRLDRLGTILALAAVGLPITALALNEVNASGQSLLPSVLLVAAVIALVISTIILILDYRKPQHKFGQSFGELGLAISILLIVGLFSTPWILSQVTGTSQVNAADVTANDVNDSLVPTTFGQNPGTSNSIPPVQGNPEQPSASADITELQTILQRETGLTTDELLAQMNAGSTLTDLVNAAGGDLDVVTTSLAEAFDTAITNGSLPTPMLEQLGDDATTIANNALNGEIPPMFLNMLLGGAQGVPPGIGSGGAPDFGAPDITTQDNVGVAPPDNARAIMPTATVTLVEPTEETALMTNTASTILPTPTPFMFDAEPTATPIPVEPTGLPTCALTIHYNLNMRTAPNTDAQLIVTIPAYTTVQSTGHNDANWWQVKYDGITGWVSGDYLTPDESCATLPDIR